ncbi:hypothetical protein B0H16DRAFT_1746855 [Mycena metata]|uniref:Uncharacterized protein n=1 Tax=Mycena metata TaxID=1033252 RepID=A0AAD7GW73_9AGAR|nr:hypothetical protein B0H16DRAFT_1746855 [Mycena metata]
MPLLAIKIVHPLKAIQPRALVDLWPRVWAWSRFFYPHRDYPGSPAELMIIGPLYVHRAHSLEVVDTQLGVRIILPKAWATFIATGDPFTPGSSELCRFINSGPNPMPPAHLAQYAVIDLVSSQLTLGHRTKNILCLQHGLLFMANSGLAQITCTLVEMKSERGARATLIQSGLLRALVLLASDQTLPKGWPFVHQLLTESMEASCCYAVLSQKVESLPEAEALVDETSDWFAESPVVHASTGARHLPKNKVGIWNMLSTSLRFNKNDSVFITVEYTAAQDHAGPVALAVLPFADIASPQTDADEQVDGSVGHELILAFSCST